jgi:hypothetical protein
MQNRFAAMQHEADISHRSIAIKQILCSAQCFFARPLRILRLLPPIKGVSHNPFNFFSFQFDFGWTGAAPRP